MGIPILKFSSVFTSSFKRNQWLGVFPTVLHNAVGKIFKNLEALKSNTGIPGIELIKTSDGEAYLKQIVKDLN